jgi:hypothetical protein
MITSIIYNLSINIYIIFIFHTYRSTYLETRKKCCGRKKIQLDFDQIREIPLSQRTTMRDLCCALYVSADTTHRRVNLGDIRRHSTAIKPSLNEEHKRGRLCFCLSMLESSSLPHNPIFSRMYNIVHIDEKWFNTMKKYEKYYLLSDEEDLIRNCNNKKIIGKVVFLATIARLRFALRLLGRVM